MKIVFVVCTLVLLYGAYEAVRVYSLTSKSRALIASASGFSRSDGVLSMLVLGDSTTVGVGTNGEGSVPGRLSKYLDASVENHAVSGARTADVLTQIESATKKKYDIILIQVGANDITHGTHVSEVRSSLERVLSSASLLSERVIVLTAGKVGDAPLMPWFVRWLLNSRTANVRDVFMETTAQFNAVYIDIYTRELNFERDIARYYASDHFHLSGEGYGEWFSIVREYVENTWPELAKN